MRNVPDSDFPLWYRAIHRLTFGYVPYGWFVLAWIGLAYRLNY